MKRKSSLKGKAIKRKKRNNLSTIWRPISFVGACFVKFSCLVIGLAMISMLFVYIYECLRTSPYIKLEKVIVTGVDGEVKREVLKMSGLNPDLSLLAINLDELKKKIERHPWIRSVNLEKRFPHTLIIRAEKEKPWAIVAMDKLYYMNRWGKIFKETDQKDDLDYPVITVFSMSGSGREKHLKWAAHVLSILESEKGPLSLEDLSEVHVKKNRDVSLYFCSLPAVIKLRGRDLDTKIDDLRKVVENLNRTGRINMVRGIDLDVRNGAVVSFKNS
ncbi:MAG: FtsQ-type POTRA domain-containing protein [Deltaproteobacteria bacterium]|nr:FtsQ-type POTRA domain-containing protein [Deltaproteobacteria bacterium]